MSDPLLDFAVERYNELQGEREEELLRSGELANLTDEELEYVDGALKGMDYSKVSHVVPMSVQPHHVLSDRYDAGLTKEEAELLNKMAMADHLGRQLAHTGAGEELLKEALAKK